MKKLISAFLMLVICFSMLCICTSTASAAELTDVPKVVSSKFAYYNKASTASENFAGYLYTGTEVTATEYNSNYSVFEYNGAEYYFLTKNFNDVIRYVVSETAYMKASADDAAPTLAELYWSTPITLLSFEKDGYYLCEYNGVRGFVEASSVGYIEKMTTVISSKLYGYASTAAEVLTRYSSAEEVDVQYSGNNWVRVAYNGYTGYASIGNLKYPEYKLDGRLYASPENLQNDTNGADFVGQIFLMAINEEADIAMVRNDAGEICWTKASSLSSAKTYSTKYLCINRKKLYKEASDSSGSFEIKYMEAVMLGEAVSVLSTGSWHEVIYDDEIYYMWISRGESCFVDEESTYDYVGETIYTQGIVDLAKEIALEWDTVYKWGEALANPDSEGRRQFDCSGFVSYVLDSVMTKYNPLYNISANLLTMFYETDVVYNAGYDGEFRVEKILPENKKPGDVLFFDAGGNGVVDHCGIYLGNNEYAHCVTDFESGVFIALLDEARTDILIGVRRFTPEVVVEANKILCTISSGRLYAERSSSAEVLYQFGTNENVTLHFVSENGWSYVTINGKTGFVYTSNIGDFIFPDAPEISIALRDGYPEISWETVEDATKYAVYRATSEDGEFKKITTVTGLSYKNSSTALEAGTTYYYKVKAVNDNGYSLFSNCAKIVPLAKPVIDVTRTLEGNPEISWKAVNGATKYSVYRSTNYNGTYKLINITENLCYTDTDSDLVDGNNYYYKVKSANAHGYSAYSSYAKVLLLDCAEISASLLDGYAKISWDAVPGATKYSVYRCETYDGTYTCISTTEGLSCTDKSASIEKGKEYFYTVRARTETSYAPSGNYVKVIPIGKPTITVTSTSAGKPKISWKAVNGATKYSVYRSTSKDGTYKLIKTTASLSYSDTSSTLIDGNNYYYKVKAVNEYGYSAYSSCAKILLLNKPVSSVSLADGYAKISWDAVPGATKYWVYRSTSKNGEYKSIATVTGLSCTDKSAGLAKGTAYYYKVRAVSDSGYTDYSNSVKVVSLAKPVITLTRTSSGKPKISWEAVTGATKYSVYRSTSKDGTYKLIKTTDSLSYTDTSSALVDGNNYYYKVKAVNEYGYSKYSSYAKMLLLNKAVISASLSDGYAKISWEKVPGATKYSVYRSTSKNGEYKCISTVTGLACTDKSAGLAKGTAYYYKVRARSENGYADYSNSEKAVPLAKPVITLTRTSSGKPKISWEAVTGATKYSVYRSTSKDGTYKLIKTTDSLSYTDTSSALVDGNNYYYKVKAVNEYGYSKYSSYAKMLLLNKAVISASLSDGYAKISWEEVPGATKYSVYRSTSKNGEYKCIATVEGLSCTDKSYGLEKGRTYYYKVRARSDGGYAEYSAYVKVVPLAKPVVSASLSQGNPEITWEAVKGATKYRIYRSDAKDGTYKLIKTTLGLSYADTSSELVDGNNYYYKVKAVNTYGYSAFSNTVNKKVSRTAE